MRLKDVNVSRVEMERGWLGLGRDKAEDDPSWDGCPECDGVGFTEAAAFMSTGGRVPRCPECHGSGRR